MTQRDSIFTSSVRSFCTAFFAVLGICVAFVAIILILAIAAFSSGKQAESTGHYTILPNADGSKKPLERHSPLLLQLSLDGTIGLEQFSPDAIRDQLNRSQQGELKDGRIRALVLRISTPGGLALPTNPIYETIKGYSKQHDVPVYAYADGLCASAGYYLACTADKIYANKTSIIGSVGVVANHFNVSGAMEKVGVQSLTLSKGKDKDALNPFRPWKKGEDADWRTIIDYLYDDFLSAVTSARPELSRKDLVEKYGARAFPAPLALEYGYIDGIVTDYAAMLEKVVEEVELSDNYQVIQMESKGWVDQLFGAQSKLSSSFQIPKAFKRDLLQGYLFLYQPGME